jgi:enterochelin esterase-like enzyme
MVGKLTINRKGGVGSIVKLQRLLILWLLLSAGCVTETPVEIVGTPKRTPVSLPPLTSTPFPTNTSPVLLSPSSTPTCIDTTGRIEEITYSGHVVEGEIPVRVYLPPCYQINPERYPSLYTLHGYPMDEKHWESLGVIEVAEAGFVEGLWEPFLIVMPRIPDPLNTQTDGGPGSYEEELLLGLIPAIEKTYRVLETEQGRGIAGVSRGGVWALEIGFRNADIFNTVAALSPALHVNNPRPAYDPFNLILHTEDLPENIFLSAAEDEGGFRTATEELSRQMQALGITHTYLLTDGIHEDATWMSIMEDLVKFVTGSWESTFD